MPQPKNLLHVDGHAAAAQQHADHRCLSHVEAEQQADAPPCISSESNC